MRRVVTVAMIAMSLVGAACGAGDTQVRVRPTNVAPITTTNPPPLDGTVLDVADEFWHSGFHVKLTEVEVFESRSIIGSRISYWLRVWGEFANQGPDVASFDPEMAIMAEPRSGRRIVRPRDGDHGLR